MKTWDKIVELLEQLISINAEMANQQLDLLDKLELIRNTNYNIQKNTYNWQNNKF